MTTRALVVIDVQRRYLHGDWRVVHPSLDVSLANVGRAVDAAEAAGLPTIAIAQQWPDASDGDLALQLADRSWDAIVDKTLPSAFAGTTLADELTRRSVDTITLCGYMTQNCVLATALDAVHRGLAVEVLGDACGAPTLATSAGTAEAATLHDTALVVLASRFAGVIDTNTWASRPDQPEPARPDGLAQAISGPG
jgi:nicotinamidase-related amidase